MKRTGVRELWGNPPKWVPPPSTSDGTDRQRNRDERSWLEDSLSAPSPSRRYQDAVTPLSTARHEAVFCALHLHMPELSVGCRCAPVASKYWADQGARSDWAGVNRTTCGPQSFLGAPTPAAAPPTPAAARFTGRHMGSGRANEVRGVAIHIDPEPLSIRAWPSGRARQSVG